MTPSIRKLVLINLLIGITVATSLTIVGNYFLNRRDIEHHMDSLLSQTALSIQAMLITDLDHDDFMIIQKKLSAIPTVAEQAHESQSHYDWTKYNYGNKFQFQIWDDHGNLVLHSANAPLKPLSSGRVGFSTRFLNHEPWRSFTTYDRKTNYNVIAAESNHMRHELGQRIARDGFIVMVLTYPLLGLLIWFVITKGLDSVKRVAREVANRESRHLDPVSLKKVPLEIQPLVDELNLLFERVKRAFEREKRFAGDAAHELRTPLAALKTHVQLALKADSLEEKDAALQKVLTATDRGTHIVQQLLTLSRLSPETFNINDMVPTNLRKLAIDNIAMLTPKAIDKDIDLELIADEKQTFEITGNITWLNILIRNLVDNAIRYTPNEGKVTVIISNQSDAVLLQVTDNGPGIPVELRERVFERFFRILGTKASGSGLGLAIVAQITNLHTASIELCEPEDHSGLSVKITFPKVFDPKKIII